MKVTRGDIEHWLIAPHETKSLEFKEKKNNCDVQTALEYCVSISNEGGGLFILGVTNTTPRQVVGTNAFENINEIQNTIYERVKFRVDVIEARYDGKRLVVFSIPNRPRGYPRDLDGRYLMRLGESVRSMSVDQIRKIVEEDREHWIFRPALEVKFTQILDFLNAESYFKLRDRISLSERETIEHFRRKQVVQESGGKWMITNLGAILFARDLERFGDEIARKAIRVIEYNGDDRSAGTKPPIQQIGRLGFAVGFPGLVKFINDRLPKVEQIGKALRETVPVYPSIAIRELVGNAIVHQDYEETGTSIMVEIFTNRVEISNPGVPIIEPERFISEVLSRNEYLAKFMRTMRICEEFGSGFDKVINAIEEHQLPAPYIERGERRTKVTLFSPRSVEEMSVEDRIRACYQHAALRWEKKEVMTNQSLRNRLGLSESRTDFVSRIIRDTLDAGIIKPADPEVTSKKYSQYVPFYA